MIQSNTSPGHLQGVEVQSPDLSIVIVNWNVRALLIDCLRALFSAEVRGSLQLEIIVVDNASSDGSAEAVQRFSGVRLIRSQRNLGYGRANNLGFRAARGKRLLVLNPDTVPQPGSLESLVQFSEQHPRAGIVAPRLLNADGTVQTAAFHFPTLAMVALDLFPPPSFLPGRVRYWLLHSPLNGRYPHEKHATQPFKIDHPLGACMLLKREAYAEAGGFNPALFMYSEEIDLALRYRKGGWECQQVPQAQVIHLGGGSTKQLPGRMYIELWRSRLYIYRQYYALPAQLALRALLLLGQLWMMAAALFTFLRGQLTWREAQRQWRVALAVWKLAL